MANLVWHQKYHPNKVCDFDNAIDYNAHLLRLIDKQAEKPDTAREDEKTAYRGNYAVNEQEFRTLRAVGCPIENEFIGFENLEEEPSSRRESAQLDLSILGDTDEDEDEKPAAEEKKEKPFFTKEEKKRWIRRAIYGGLAVSTLAVAAALGYWAFKPKAPPTQFPRG